MDTNTEILDNLETGSNDLALNQNAISFLQETGKWCKFLSILGFIGIAFMIGVSLMFGTVMTALSGQMPMASSWFSVIYLVLAGVYVMPVLYLYQFSNKIKLALDYKDNLMLSEALGKLKSHYKFVGIVVIALMALYAFIFLFALIGGVGLMENFM